MAKPKRNVFLLSSHTPTLMPTLRELPKGLKPQLGSLPPSTPSPSPPNTSCVAKSQPGHCIIKERRQSLPVALYLSWERLFLGEPPGLQARNSTDSTQPGGLPRQTL